MVDIYCYLEREYYKVLKFYVNSFSQFEISAASFTRHPPISAASQGFEIKYDKGLSLEKKENVAYVISNAKFEEKEEQKFLEFSQSNISGFHCVKSVRIRSFLVRIFPHSD